MNNRTMLVLCLCILGILGAQATQAKTRYVYDSPKLTMQATVGMSPVLVTGDHISGHFDLIGALPPNTTTHLTSLGTQLLSFYFSYGAELWSSNSDINDFSFLLSTDAQGKVIGWNFSITKPADGTFVLNISAAGGIDPGKYNYVNYVDTQSPAGDTVYSYQEGVINAVMHPKLVWSFSKVAELGDDLSGASVKPTVDGNHVAFNSLFPMIDPGLAGIYSNVTGVLAPAADVSTFIPNGTGPFTMDGFIVSPPSLDEGRLAFRGTGIDGQEGIYTWSAGSLDAVVDTTTPVPGDTNTFTYIGAPALDNGRIVFHGESSDGPGIYIYNEANGGSLAALADTTTPIPTSAALPPGVAGNFLDFTLFPSIDGDEVAFGGFGRFFPGIPNTLRGIYLASDDHVDVVADIFSPVPGHPQNTFQVFDLSPSLHRGITAFHAEDSSGRAGIYVGNVDSLALVADSDTAVPGDVTAYYPDGSGTFDQLGQFPSINHDNVAFSNGEYGIYLSIAGNTRSLTKVFDNADLPNSDFIIDTSLFHEALSGNALAFASQVHRYSDAITITNIMHAELVKIAYPDFSDMDFLYLNGSTQQNSSALRLTPDSPSLSGSAFFPIPFTKGPDLSFHTQFTFQISGVNDGGPMGSDGLAFVIQSDSRGAQALGNDGEGQGFGINNTTANPVAPIAPSVAIEFDTHGNVFDQNDNHVALILDGDVSDHRAQGSPDFALNSGSLRYVWIDYAGQLKRLDVYISESDAKPVSPLFTMAFDLTPILGKEAFFGFTAGTGDGFNAHDIVSWDLDVRSFPTRGDFNGDGCVDRMDLSEILAAIRGSSAPNPVFDLNGDGVVSIGDARKLVLLFSNPRGESCN